MKILNSLKAFFLKHRRVLMIALTAVIVGVLTIQTFMHSSTRDPEPSGEITASNVNPNSEELMSGTTVVPSTAEPSETSSAATQPVSSAASTKPTNAQTTTMEPPVPFATAIVHAEPADYQAQWDAGYLLAIDNPDTSYATSVVTLSDADRDLLERLCMGEFGSGGFIGAALIAQSVKDAMCFDGYTSVQDVIKYCRYDGSTSVGTNDACRQAVRYIFDDNHDAVQHRLMYMYNPYLVTSSFHESQNFILSYSGVRFFDRW